MPLFTNAPVALTFEDAQPDCGLSVSKSYVFRAQLPDAKSVVGEYVEAINTSEDIIHERLLVKYTDTAKTRRGLLSLQSEIKTNDDTFASSPVNLTFVYNKNTAAGDIKQQLETMRCLLGKSGFIDGFVAGMIDAGSTL
jgi:hypothetical protein